MDAKELARDSTIDSNIDLEEVDVSTDGEHSGYGYIAAMINGDSINLYVNDTQALFLKVKVGSSVTRMLPNLEREVYEVLEVQFIRNVAGSRSAVSLHDSGYKGYYKCRVRKEETIDTMGQKNTPVDTKKVFVVHGRDTLARDALFGFLRSTDLNPIEWSMARGLTGKPTPYVGEILDAAFSHAQAIVVLLTGDDLACLVEELRKDDGPEYEKELTPQARPNVLFEAGIAFGTHPDRVILLQLGKIRPFSDIAGRQIMEFSDDAQCRKDLADRLKTAGCSVNLSGKDWITAGDFTNSSSRSLKKLGTPVKMGSHKKQSSSNEIAILRQMTKGEFMNASNISSATGIPILVVKYLIEKFKKDGFVKVVGFGNLTITDAGMGYLHQSGQL